LPVTVRLAQRPTPAAAIPSAIAERSAGKPPVTGCGSRPASDNRYASVAANQRLDAEPAVTCGDQAVVERLTAATQP